MNNMQITSDEDSIDLFTPQFKHFRRLADADCFKDAFSISTHPEQFERCFCSSIDSISIDSSLGFQPISTWEVYRCRFAQGLYFLPNPFTMDGQRLWIDRCVNEYAKQSRTSVGDNSTNAHLDRIRWATLGFHYDWTEKVYRPDDFTTIPQPLNEMFESLMKYFVFSTGCSTMRAEAVIINYYHLKSTLCAHTDYSEVDALDHPLLSLSFGNAAVFLIGGEKKSSCVPSALLLRSGDVVLMTGPSRLFYHGVPRIFVDPFVSQIFSQHHYISEKRLNINVRQVYKFDDEEKRKASTNV